MLTNKTFKISLCFLLLLLVVGGCKKSKFKISETKVELQIVRFEKELFKFDAYSIADSSKNLAKKYPDFTPLFSNKIIEIGDTIQPRFGNSLEVFVTDQAIYSIYKRVIEVFPDLNKQKKELEIAFGRFQFLFPDKRVPTIYTYISGFNQSMVTADGIIGISLEKYMGSNDALYSQVYPAIPQYQRYVMYPDKIPTDAMRAWISTEFEFNSEQRNLLSLIIYEGREKFLLKQLFPEENDTVIWGFTPKQLQFCLENEKQMWTYLIEQKLLFINDNFRISQLVEEAPFTKDFSQESPGKAAVWIGYKIVESFMNKQNKVSLQDLMNITNYQSILNQSKYNP